MPGPESNLPSAKTLAAPPEATAGFSLKPAVDALEQIFRLLRDAALGLLFFCLVLFPHFLNSRLVSAGFTKIEKGGVTWEKQVEAANQQTKAAAETVSGAKSTLQDISQQLSQISAQSSDVKVKSAISGSIAQLNGTLGAVSRADDSLKETVLTQQDLLAQSTTAPVAAAQRGWIYIGGVDESKQKWADGSPKNILPASLPLAPGQTITVSGLSYLRGDSSAQHKDASVASVVRDRTRLRIEQIDYSHAIAGGWFVWLKVGPAGS